MSRAQLALAEAGLTGTYQGQQTLAVIQQKFNQAVAEAGLTGTYNGAPTMEAVNQQNQTALGLMGLQAQLWATKLGQVPIDLQQHSWWSPRRDGRLPGPVPTPRDVRGTSAGAGR